MPTPNSTNSVSRVPSTPVKMDLYRTSSNHNQSVQTLMTRSNSVNSRKTAASTMTVTRPRRLTLDKGVRITTGPAYAPVSRSAPGPLRSRRNRGRTPRECSACAQCRLAVGPDVLEGLERVVQCGDLEQRQSGYGVGERLGAVLRRGQEHLGTVAFGRDQLLRDAADRADVAVVVDRPGTGDDLAAGQILRLDLVDY